MPEDLRKIIQEEADAAAKDQTELQATKQGQMMWKLAQEHGMSLQAIKPAELAKLRALARPVFDDFVKKAKPQPHADSSPPGAGEADLPIAYRLSTS